MISAYDDNIADTVVTDLDNQDIAAVPENTEVKYSMLGC